MPETSSLSEVLQTADAHNSGLTGRIEPANVEYHVPLPAHVGQTVIGIPVETNTDAPGQEKPETREEDTAEQETEQPEDNSTRMGIRMSTARRAQKLLDDPTISLAERLRIMATIEKLTTGARSRGKGKQKGKTSLFGVDK